MPPQLPLHVSSTGARTGLIEVSPCERDSLGPPDLKAPGSPELPSFKSDPSACVHAVPRCKELGPSLSCKALLSFSNVGSWSCACAQASGKNGSLALSERGVTPACCSLWLRLLWKVLQSCQRPQRTPARLSSVSTPNDGLCSVRWTFWKTLYPLLGEGSLFLVVFFLL